MKPLLYIAISVLSFGISSQVTAGNWQYDRNIDPMSGKPSRTAQTNSLNSVQVAPHYSANTKATLVLRQHPQYGLDLILSISSGQFICSPGSGCKVQIRFDENHAFNASASMPSDFSHNSIFIIGAAGLIPRIEKSQRMLIKTTMYQAGDVIWEFNTQDLKWTEPKPKIPPSPPIRINGLTPAERRLQTE